jgi:alanyl aminopeptidase
MQEDAQVSARQIRQPIAEHSDIGSAFDGITYEKGSAVLSMLERFVGEDNFKRGIQQYMEVHRFGNADARDFVRAIAATRTDLPEGQVERAFFSFLEQPGTPLVALNWTCAETGVATLSVEQSRYLPLGSKGDSDQQWLLPLCVAFGDAGGRGEHCELIQGSTASFDLPTPSCPDYVMPNADAAGYYRFTMDNGAWNALLSAPDLTDAEWLAIAASLSGAFHAGEVTAGDYLTLVRALLKSDNVEVVTAPLGDLAWIHDRLLTPRNQGRLRAKLAGYYADIAARVPIEHRPTDRADVQLQSDIAWLYARLIAAPAWRRQLTETAVAYVESQEAAGEPAAVPILPSNLRETALSVAVEMEGPAFAERLLRLFHQSTGALVREEILRALSGSGDGPMLRRLRELALSDAVRDNEVRNIIGPQIDEPESRDAAWRWLLANFDAVAERAPYWFRGSLVEYGSEFCSGERVEEINRQVADKVRSMGGGPRSLARTIERIQLCEALVKFHEDTANSQLSSERFSGS